MRLAPTLSIAALLLWGAAAAAAQADDAGILRAFEERIGVAVEKAAAVTVSIKVDRKADTAKGPNPRAGSFMNGGPFGKRPDAPVSGFILEPDGWIATSYFNIQGDLNGVEVTLPDGTVHAAEVKGWNINADITLLKIEATGLPTLAAADAAELRTGDHVVAVGRAPDGRGVTANPGILSAAGRHSGRSVQVDARLNFGNVGGPLVTLDGKLIGMSCKVTMINAGDRGQNSGVSYVMLYPKIVEALPGLKKGVRVEGGGGRPFLGVGPDNAYDGKDGVKLSNVQAGSSADKAGLKIGDIILALDGVKTPSFNELRGEILKRKIGDSMTVRIRRGAEELDIPLSLGESPGD